MLIYDSNSYVRDPAGVGGKIAKIVGNFGGEVLVSRLWNEQRLAYPIKGHRKGTYWLTYFSVDSTKLTDFKRACRLEDDIIRSLTLRVDPRLVEALVAHAKGERLLPRPAEEILAVVAAPDAEIGPLADGVEWEGEEGEAEEKLR
jgi:small subunit ribosomal protein S6